MTISMPTIAGPTSSPLRPRSLPASRSETLQNTRKILISIQISNRCTALARRFETNVYAAPSANGYAAAHVSVRRLRLRCAQQQHSTNMTMPTSAAPAGRDRFVDLDFDSDVDEEIALPGSMRARDSCGAAAARPADRGCGRRRRAARRCRRAGALVRQRRRRRCACRGQGRQRSGQGQAGKPGRHQRAEPGQQGL